MPTGAEGAPLNDGEAREMQAWVFAASAWGEAAQSLVGAATYLALRSRELSDLLDGGDGRGLLAKSLRTLAGAVESETAELRDRYLATAANLDEYRDLLG
jgi:hypothetical protein